MKKFDSGNWLKRKTKHTETQMAMFVLALKLSGVGPGNTWMRGLQGISGL